MKIVKSSKWFLFFLLMPLFLFSSNPVFSYEIVFAPGNNLCSLPLSTDDPNLPQILTSIQGQYTAVFGFRPEENQNPWKTFIPSERPDFLNTLTELDEKYGFWIQLSEQATFHFSGSRVKSAVIPLIQGWNLIGYPTTKIKETNQVMSQIASNIEIVCSYMEGEWKEYNPNIPVAQNTLQYMLPGYGYWIKSKTNQNLYFDGNSYDVFIDTDDDGLSDHEETIDFFGYDFIEIEDYIESSNILNYQYGITLVSDGSYAKLSSFMNPGRYCFYLTGTADVDQNSTLEAINLYVDSQTLQDVDRFWSSYQSGTLVSTYEFNNRKALFYGPTFSSPGDILYDPDSNSFYMIRRDLNTVEVRHYDLNWNLIYDMGSLNHCSILVSSDPSLSYYHPRVVKAGNYFYVGYSIGSNNSIIRKYSEDWNLENEIYSANKPLTDSWGDLDYDGINSQFLITTDIYPNIVQIDRYNDSWQYQDTITFQDDPNYYLTWADLYVSENEYLLAYARQRIGSNETDIYLKRSTNPGNLASASPIQITTEPDDQRNPRVTKRGGFVYIAYVSNETFDGNWNDYYTDIFLVKIDGSNNRIWKRQLTSSQESEAKINPILLNAGGKLHITYFYEPDEAGQDPPRSYFALYPGQATIPAYQVFWVLTGETDIYTSGNHYLTFALDFTPTSSGIGNVRSDRIIINKQGSDPNRPDTDGDGLSDREEISLGTFVLNTDPDEDGLSDAREIAENTDPLRRDTDGDGILDGVELGFIGTDIDPYTCWDTNIPTLHGPLARPNRDADPNTITDPTNPDTDGDGLPDGWIDGWFYYRVSGWRLDVNSTEIWTGHHHGPQKYAVIQRWEGEDFDGDGCQDIGSQFLWSFSPPVGELRPDLIDSEGDGLPDGWEVRFAFNPLDPNDAAADLDTDTNAILIINSTQIQTLHPDGLTNLQEYQIGTNPRNPDTDSDGLLDGEEVARVIWRTNVPDGAKKFDHYGSLWAQGIYEWVMYNNTEYGYEKSVNIQDPSLYPQDFPSYNEYLESIWPILELPDKTIIMIDRIGERVFIWEPFSLFSKPGFHGTFQGIVHVYTSSQSQGQAETSPSPDPNYSAGEIYQTDSLNPDSDQDDIPDGQERDWSLDPDADGLVNARDQDCDGDGLLNTLEVDPNGDVDEDGLPHIFDPDSDNDGLLDGKEWNPFQDFDGDGLLNLFDSDSDNDGLPDGWIDANINGQPDIGEYEDKNADGRLDAGETSPVDVDTDGDGLWDGFNQTIIVGSQLWRTFASYNQFFYQKRFNYTKLETYQGELTSNTNPRLPDTDSDGVLDGNEVYGWEMIIRGLGIPLTPEDYQPDPPPYIADYASGGWPRARIVVASDPNRKDTDEDGLDDGQEFASGTHPGEEDTDMDGIPDAVEILLTYDGGHTNPAMIDSDFDYLPDGWVDFDGDGLKDPSEGEDLDADGTVDHGETNPLLADMDGDYLRDGLERGIVVFRATSANYQDPNVEIAVDIGETGLKRFSFSGTASGLPSNGYSLNFSTPEGYSLFFDPNNRELYIDTGSIYAVLGNTTSGKIPVVVNPVFAFRGHEILLPVSNPFAYDSDGDGLSDGEEFYALSLFPTQFRRLFNPDGDANTNFYDSDSDGDGLPDKTDPFSTDQGSHWWKDIDGDGLPCALDTDSDGDTYTDANDSTPFFGDRDEDGVRDTDEGNQVFGLDPNNPDTDGDGLEDGLEKWWQDTDGDGLYNGNDQDADQDGLPDGWMDGFRWDGSGFVYDPNFDDDQAQNWEGEDLNGNGLLEAGETSHLYADTDGDGLWDGYNRQINNQIYLGELFYLSNPRKADTDGDGLADGAEAQDYYLEETLPEDPNALLLILSSGEFRLSVTLQVSGKDPNFYPHQLTVEVKGHGDPNAIVLFNQDPVDMTGAEYMGYLGEYQITVFVEMGHLNIGLYRVDISTDGWLRGLTLYRKGLDPTSADSDKDGLTDKEELALGTSPCYFDTDRDGIKDGLEIEQGLDPLSIDTDRDLFSDYLDLQPSAVSHSRHRLEMAWAFWSYDFLDLLPPGMDRATQKWKVINGRHSEKDRREDGAYLDTYAPTTYFANKEQEYGKEYALKTKVQSGFDNIFGHIRDALFEEGIDLPYDYNKIDLGFYKYLDPLKYEIDIIDEKSTGKSGWYHNRIYSGEIDDYWYFVNEDLNISLHNTIPTNTLLPYLLIKVTLMANVDQSFTLQFFSPLSSDQGKDIFFYYKLYQEGNYIPVYEGCTRANPLRKSHIFSDHGEHPRTLYSADFLFPAEIGPSLPEDEDYFLYLVPMVIQDQSEIKYLRNYQFNGDVLISAVASFTQSVISAPHLILTMPDIDQNELIEAYLEGNYPVSGTGQIWGKSALFYDLDSASIFGEAVQDLKEAIAEEDFSILILSSRSFKNLSSIKDQLSWDPNWFDHEQITYHTNQYWGNEAIISENWIFGYDKICLYRDIQESSFHLARPLSERPENMALFIQEGTDLMLSKSLTKLPDQADGNQVDQTGIIYTAYTIKKYDAIALPLMQNGGNGHRKPIEYKMISIIERRDDPNQLHLDEDPNTLNTLQSCLNNSDPFITLFLDKGLIFEARIDNQQYPNIQLTIYTPEGSINLVDVELNILNILDLKIGGGILGKSAFVMDFAIAGYYYMKALESHDEIQRQYYQEKAAEYSIYGVAGVVAIFCPPVGIAIAIADLSTMGITYIIAEYWEPWPDHLAGAGIVKLAVQDYCWYRRWYSDYLTKLEDQDIKIEIMKFKPLSDPGIYLLELTPYDSDTYISDVIEIGIDLTISFLKFLDKILPTYTTADEKYLNAEGAFSELQDTMEGWWDNTYPPSDPNGIPDAILNVYIGQDPPDPP